MPPEQPNFEDPDFDNHLETEKVGLEDAKSFEELYAMLEILGAVQGTQKIYAPADLKRKIEEVRQGHEMLNTITRSYGLRKTVARLLEIDSLKK